MSIPPISLVGTWNLETYAAFGSDGSLREPLGPDPVGIGIYTAGGHVSAQLMRRERTGHSRRDVIAYAGDWTIRDESVWHHVRVALDEDWIGIDLVRTVTVSAHQLVLEPPPFQQAGVTLHSRLSWSRLA